MSAPIRCQASPVTRTRFGPAGRLERVEVWAASWQAARPDFAFCRECLFSAGIDQEAVAEVFADEVLRHLIEEQDSLSDVALLTGCEDRDDEAVADVDVELVSGPSAGCVRVQPGPHPLGLLPAGLSGVGDKVLPLGSPAAHAYVDELILPPYRIHTSGAAWYLIVGPVGEPEQWLSLEFIHCPDGTGLCRELGLDRAEPSFVRVAARSSQGVGDAPR